jgi:hypothetical protein
MQPDHGSMWRYPLSIGVRERCLFRRWTSVLRSSKRFAWPQHTTHERPDSLSYPYR